MGYVWILMIQIKKRNSDFSEFLLMRAIDGARTRGLDLGKVARYQLRHYRICRTNSTDLIIIHDFTYFVNVIFVFFHVQNMLLSADNQSG